MARAVVTCSNHFWRYLAKYFSTTRLHNTYPPPSRSTCVSDMFWHRWPSFVSITDHGLPAVPVQVVHSNKMSPAQRMQLIPVFFDSQRHLATKNRHSLFLGDGRPAQLGLSTPTTSLSRPPPTLHRPHRRQRSSKGLAHFQPSLLLI